MRAAARITPMRKRIFFGRSGLSIRAIDGPIVRIRTTSVRLWDWLVLRRRRFRRCDIAGQHLIRALDGGGLDPVVRLYFVAQELDRIRAVARSRLLVRGDDRVAASVRRQTEDHVRIEQVVSGSQIDLSRSVGFAAPALFLRQSRVLFPLRAQVLLLVLAPQPRLGLFARALLLLRLFQLALAFRE